MNIWTHLRDESIPLCLQEYINPILKLRREQMGLMMHIKWRQVVTAFYEANYKQYLVPRGEVIVPPKGAKFYTVALYDGCGCRVQIELFQSKNSSYPSPYS